MIKNIIFDFGGVLLDIDYDATYDAFTEIMGVDVSKDSIPPQVRKTLEAFEIGAITEEVFLWRLQNVAPSPPNPRKLIQAWNAMLGPIDKSKLNMLLDLQKEYEVYLLSNTNSIHLDHVYKYLKQEHGIYHFDTKYFDRTFYSHLIGIRKPNVSIYHHVIHELGIVPEESIFIDDLTENVEGAKKAGLKAVHHKAELNIVDHIQEYLTA